MKVTIWNKKHTWNFISQAEMHNFIESSICMKPERLSEPKHPAQKPVKILEKMIRIASNENDIIFDPFMGVGSTGVAAMNLNRKFIGVELNREYFDASVKRVNTALRDAIYNNNSLFREEPHHEGMVCEPIQPHMASDQLNMFSALPEWAEILQKEQELKAVNLKAVEKKPRQKKERKKIVDGRLKPLLKWPGGKEKELKFIIPEAPQFNNYYEPFVGGGSVYAAFDAQHFYINDKSEELTSLYDYISRRDDEFFGWADAIDASWKRMLDFSEEKLGLKELYIQLREDKITAEELSPLLRQHINEERQQVEECLDERFTWKREDFFALLYPTLKRKLLRMKKIEMERNIMPDGDIMDNIETAYMGMLYTHFRALYNDKQLCVENVPLHTALFLYLRYNAYSGMFRYNDDGEFNVPCGGISYNHKTLEPELNYYRSDELHHHFQRTTLENLDFEVFFHLHEPKENDFIFLDPPYDSEFSTYAQNDFTRADQERLANYLLMSVVASG